MECQKSTICIFDLYRIMLMICKIIFRIDIIVVILFFMTAMCRPINYNESNPNLGLSNVGDEHQIRVWSPLADKMRIQFYLEGHGGHNVGQMPMNKDLGDIWTIIVPREYWHHFYTIQIFYDGRWMNEVVDPYAKLVGVNGSRAYLGTPSEADPADWDSDIRPENISPENAIIYELQIRDFSIGHSSGSAQSGKYMAFTEEKTSLNGLSTGLSHLKEMGVTHVHLLPTFDFRSIDESRPELNTYNWGYDPLNYNVPEGSFSTDPFDPLVRVREFKQMVMSLHHAGIGVVMDVVYNHTGLTNDSNFDQLVPGYYYRQNVDGTYSNASACGNETASEKPMMRRFMLESMKYWMEEYHIDGFRVDLMGIHDIETMNVISQELRAINPQALIYGEGWAAGASPLPETQRALKQNTSKLDHIAVFSDEIRDGMKGHWMDPKDRGFISGKKGSKESVKFGIVGGVYHPQVDYALVNNTDFPWAAHPMQTINYVSCHDGLTLYDKLMISMPKQSAESRKKMHLLANTIVLTSQGIPFLHAGVEFMRTKKGVDNSYQSPDSINAIDWTLKEKNIDVYEYHRRMIQLRKDHPAFRMKSSQQVEEAIQFIDHDDPLVIAYVLDGTVAKDTWSKILVVFNGDLTKKKVSLPEGEWNIFLLNQSFEQAVLKNGELTVHASSAAILYLQ